MAGNDSQRNLLTLIRNFSSEKSEGERRILNLKKRIEELRSELDAANMVLEQAKSAKETMDQELKGYEVELSINDASLQSLEARISATNNEISTLSSELVALKSEASSSRDAFIGNMLELNAEIRKFQECFVSTFNADNCNQATLNGGTIAAHEQDSEQARLDTENKLAQLILHTDQEEQQLKAEEEIHDQLQNDLHNLERKVLLLESVRRESIELQELGRQTSELEEKCAAFGEELQKRFLCPRCNQDNSGELSQILQTSDGS